MIELAFAVPEWVDVFFQHRWQQPPVTFLSPCGLTIHADLKVDSFEGSDWPVQIVAGGRSIRGILHIKRRVVIVAKRDFHYN